MIIAAFDPGLAGGLAFLDNDDPLLAIKLPIVAKKVDVLALSTFLNMYEPRAIIVEKQQIRQHQGGAMTIGANYGRILGTIEMLGMPYKEVVPNTWKKKAGIPTGVKGKEKKEASYEACCRTFGRDVVTKLGLVRTRDGPCDAVLIGRFG